MSSSHHHLPCTSPSQSVLPLSHACCHFIAIVGLKEDYLCKHWKNKMTKLAEVISIVQCHAFILWNYFRYFICFAVNTSWRKMVSKLVPYSFLDFSLQYLYVYHVWMCFEENALFSSCEGVHANVCSWLGWKHFEVLRLGLVFSDPAQPADRGAESGNVVGNCANICRAQRRYWWSTCSISLSYIDYWIWCKYWYSLKLKVGVHGLKNVLKLSFSSWMVLVARSRV